MTNKQTKSKEDLLREINILKKKLAALESTGRLHENKLIRQNEQYALLNSELTKSREQYKSAYELFRLLADTTNDMLWAKDMQGNFTFTNKAICEKLINAKDVNEPIGKHVMFFVKRERAAHPENKNWFTFGEECGDSDAITIKEQKTCRFEEYGNVFGKYLILDVYKTPIWNEKGEMIGTVGSARDITEQRRVEEQLKESEKKYRLLATNTLDSIWTTDMHLNLTFVNDTVIDLLGYTPEEIYKLNLAEITPPESLKIIMNEGKKLIAKYKQGKIVQAKFEIQHFKKDGKLIDVKVTTNLLVDEKGTILGFQGRTVDISLRKEMETKLKRSEKLSRSITESAADAIISINSEGKILLWNPAASDMFGYNKEEMINRNLSEIIPEQYKFSHSHALKKIKKTTGMEKSDRRIIEISARRKDGTEFPIELSLSSWEISGEKYYTGIIRDISERKKYEKELETALEKAQESDRLKTAFLANMSHEIRTPMNGILGFSNLLKDPNLTHVERKEYTDIINKSSDRLLNTMSDLIEISKIESGQVEITKTKISVNKLLDELFDLFQHDAFKKGLSFSIAPGLSDEKATITTDKGKLQRILSNLIKNANKFTEKGGVSFGYVVKGKFLEFFVKDTGIGVPYNRQQAIFNRFEQADIEDTRAFQGSGLGLSISKAYTEMLGGNIWLTSEEGKGSTFRFTIPYDTREKTATEPEAKATKTRQKENTDINRQLLIVEDEETSSLYLETILKDMFAKISFAKTGKEAVEICRNNSTIDIILMDIKMPEMNGYEATREIRKFNKNVIIIAQTAHALAGDKTKALEAGCNDYISKPINKTILFKIIKNLL